MRTPREHPVPRRSAAAGGKLQADDLFDRPMPSTIAREGWVIASMAVALAATLALQAFVFRGDAITNDENSYLFQARVFSMGRTWLPPPADRGLVQFPTSMINMTRDRWFSRYSAGHPLALVPGVALGYPLLMPLLFSAATVFVTYRLGRRWYDEPTARSAAGLMALSPYFAAMHATLLSHTTALFCFALFALAATHLVHAARLGWGITAGISLGYLFNTRPYTAVLVAWPFLAYVGWHVVRSPSRRLFLQVVAAAVTGLLSLGAYFAYNAATTGDWRVAPYSLYNPDERPGFGTVGSRVHTPERGAQHVRLNLERLNDWWLGFNGSLFILGGLAATRWRWHDGLLLASALSLVAGYFFFYFGGVRTIGPVYYFEAVLPLSLLGGRSLIALWRLGASRGPVMRRVWRLGAGACVLTWIAALGFFYQDRIESLTSFFGSQRRLHAALTSAQPGDALILLDTPENAWFGVRYDPRAPLGPIFVRADEEREARIRGRYPDRPIYRYRHSRLERIQ